MRKILGLMTILLLAVPLSAFSADWYVDDNGSDNNDCTNGTSDACKTVNYVLKNKVSAGDTIFVMPGNYGTEQGTINVDDSTNHDNLTITAADPNDKPQFIGTDSNKVGFRVGYDSDVTGVTISYLIIQGSTNGYTGGPPVLNMYDSGYTIDNNEISRGGSCIIVRGNSITISNNHIHDCGLWDSESDSHGVGIWSGDFPSGWDEQILIENNTIEYCEGDGFQDATPTANNGYVYLRNNVMRYFGEQPVDLKYTNNIKFEGNDVSYGNQRTTERRHYCQFHGNDNGAVSYIWIWNNVFHDDAYCGIDNEGPGSTSWYVWNNVFYNLMQEPAYNNSGAVDSLPNGSYVTNNTFYNIRQISGEEREVTGVRAGVNGDRVQNNIFFNCGDDDVDDDGAISSEDLSGNPTYNYIYSTRRGDSSCAGSCYPADSNDVVASDPGWVDKDSFKFELKSNSVCINRGTNIAGSGDYTPVKDKAGNSRLNSVSFDIGAYEYIRLELEPPKNLRLVADP